MEKVQNDRTNFVQLSLADSVKGNAVSGVSNAPGSFLVCSCVGFTQVGDDQTESKLTVFSDYRKPKSLLFQRLDSVAFFETNRNEKNSG
jgi:hypothetical protein